MTPDDKTPDPVALNRTQLAVRLSSLLARIHRDGGHYEASHGTDKACEDADRIVADLYAAIPANPAQMTDALTAAVVALARHGIEPDVQSLLIDGNPSRGIRPGAINAALTAAIGAGGQAVAEPALCQYEFDDGTIDHYAGCFGEIHEVNGKKVVRRTPLYTHPAPSGQAVAVKALEWTLIDEEWWTAETVVGGYEIRQARASVRTRFPKKRQFEPFDGTVEAAKAAAQADFERRILSALAHPVQPAAEGQAGWRDECATEGCGKPASVHFIRGDIGSYYCHACYLKVQTLPASPKQETNASKGGQS